MFRVRPYTAQNFEAWNAFNLASKNGTFLFDRNYMDYHSDRFADYSLLIVDEQDQIAGLLPACREGSVVRSHAGLTYGGIVTDDRMRTSRMLDLFGVVVRHLRERGVDNLEYKTIPSIYHRLPAQEDLYALFRLKADLIRRDVLSVIQLPLKLKFQSRRLRGIKKAESFNVKISETSRWESFWSILSDNLRDKHGKEPVHSLQEILLLRGRFPEHVRLFTAQMEDEVVAGAVMYCAPPVVHVQYIASNESGRKVGALDLLFAHLIRDFSGYSYFDFGISTEENGYVLNEGLIEFKEGFGASCILHDQYILRLGKE